MYRAVQPIMLGTNSSRLLLAQYTDSRPLNAISAAILPHVTPVWGGGGGEGVRQGWGG